MPQACIETILVPIYKNNKSNIHDKNNYRPIALATLTSKLFEYFILQQISPLLTTSSNQFGFKRKHSTDQCVFLYKQAVSYYVNQNSPVFSTFLDASKAFDRVNHKLLFKKLSNRNIPACFVRLLAYWYSTQYMKVRWGNISSSPFTVSNGVRQGGVLSPYLFFLYMDDLSRKLNSVQSGCFVGSSLLNHLMFADDLCAFSPSVKGLQKLVNLCKEYALNNCTIFSNDKTLGMIYQNKKFKVNVEPNIILDGRCIKFVNSVKYLGVLITDDLLDDLDINRHLRYLYCVGNTRRLKFRNCSSQVKNVLFRSYCMSMYSVHLWCKFKINSLNPVRIAYNNSFRILHNIPRQESARTRQIQSNIKIFDAPIRNYLYSFLKRCNNSIYISCLMSSDALCKSIFWINYNNTLYQN